MLFSPFVSSLIRITSVNGVNGRATWVGKDFSRIIVTFVVLTSFLGRKWNIIRLWSMFDCDHYKTAELIFLHCHRHICGGAHSNRPWIRFISNNSSFTFCAKAKLIKLNLSWHIFQSLCVHCQCGGKRKKGEIGKISSRSTGVNRKWISDWALLASCKQKSSFLLLQSFAIACLMKEENKMFEVSRNLEPSYRIKSLFVVQQTFNQI